MEMTNEYAERALAMLEPFACFEPQDVMKRYLEVKKYKTGLGDFLEECAAVAYCHEGFQDLDLSELSDDEVKVLIKFYETMEGF